MLADMATELDAARLLVWRAAWMQDQGGAPPRESSIAKYYAARAAMRACNARRPNPRRLRLHARVRRRALPARRQAGRDRRGDERGPEDGDRARDPADGGRGRRRAVSDAADDAPCCARATCGPAARARCAALRRRACRRRTRGAARHSIRHRAAPWSSASPGNPGVGKSTLVDALIGAVPGRAASGSAWWRSIRRARSRAARCWAIGSACSATPPTPACSSARWRPAATWGACRARRRRR